MSAQGVLRAVAKTLRSPVGFDGSTGEREVLAGLIDTATAHLEAVPWPLPALVAGAQQFGAHLVAERCNAVPEWVCPSCGSGDVQGEMWVELRTNKPLDDQEGNWCPQCAVWFKWLAPSAPCQFCGEQPQRCTGGDGPDGIPAHDYRGPDGR